MNRPTISSDLHGVTQWSRLAARPQYHNKLDYFVSRWIHIIQRGTR